MKIALVHNFPLSKTTGGAERTAFKILKQLISLNYDVVYCTLGSNHKKVCLGYLKRHIKHYSFPQSNPFTSSGSRLGKIFFHIIEAFNIRTFFDFWKVAKHEGFRFVFFHNPKGLSYSIWACAILQSIPFCIVNHDYYNICINSCFFKKNSGVCDSQCLSCKTFRFVPWLLHFFSDFVIFLSHNQKKIFNAQGWFLNSKAFIIPPSISPAVHKPKPYFTKKVGFIGRLDATKGIGDFIALSRLFSSSDLTFYIQTFKGDPLLSYYKTRTNDIKRLKWVHKNNFVFLREIDFLIVPSKWEEPFGRVFLEALSVGTPCIGYPRGAIPEIMNGNLSIFIAESCEVKAIEKKLLFFYGNENFYKRYSLQCIKRYNFFKYLFSRSMISVISRV